MFKFVILFSILPCFSFAESPLEPGPVTNDTALVLEGKYLEIADILATSQNKFGACADIEAYTTDIVESLLKAKNYYDLNLGYNTFYERTFTPSDDVLESLSTTLILREIMGEIDYSNLQSFQTALEGVVMHGPAPGAFGHVSSLEFGKDGEVLQRKMSFNDEGLPVWEEFEGSYLVEEQIEFGLVVAFYYETDGYETRYVLNYSFEIGQWYMLPLKTIEFNNNPFLDGYVDLPDECSA